MTTDDASKTPKTFVGSAVYGRIKRPKNAYSTKHQHEPQIPPALDAEGRCLICILMVEKCNAERELSESRAQCEAMRRDAAELAVAAYCAICESNGIGDNEWKLPQGVAECEFPVTSYLRAMERLGKALDPFQSAIDEDNDKLAAELWGKAKGSPA